MMTAVEKFLKTSPHLTSWDTTHTVRTILNPETVQTPTLVAKVVSLHGTAASMVTPTDRDTQVPLMDISTTCGVTGNKARNNLYHTQATTTTQTSSDSVGVKLTPIRVHVLVRTLTCTGVCTTHPPMVDRVYMHLLRDTTDMVTTTTSVQTVPTHTG